MIATYIVTSAGYHHGNLRDAALALGLETLETEGLDALSLRALAKRTGVTHTALGHEFGSRNALLAALAERGFTDLDAQLSSSVHDQHDALQIYGTLGLTYVRFAFDRPRLYGLMFGSHIAERQNFPELIASGDAVFARFCQAIEACQCQGLLVAGCSAEHTAFCWSAVHGLVSLVIEGQLPTAHLQTLGREGLAQMVVSRVFSGLRL